MSAQLLITHLRERRQAAGLSQSALAARVGVSRQTLHAVESGRQIPATSLSLLLARELRCAVSELFRLATGPTVFAQWCGGQGQTPSRVVLGRVEGRWMAHPVSADGVPADGVATGGVAGDSTVEIELFADPDELARQVLVVGCAPLLGVLAGRVNQRYRDARARWIPANSSRALEFLRTGAVHVAGIHLAEASGVGDHSTIVQSALPGRAATLIHLTRWRQGLVVSPGNPRGIRTGLDLLRSDVTWVRRDAGSGAQRLAERLATVDSTPRAAGPIAASHAEVAQLVRWGVGDVGVAIETTAAASGLDFVPLVEEGFDLVVPNSTLELPAVGRFVDALGASDFRVEASRFAGYDLADAGRMSSVGAIR